MHLDAIVSVYAFSRDGRFEQAALELLARVDHTNRGSATKQLGLWGCNANLELASYYHEKGDLENVIKHFAAVIPVTAGLEWKTIVIDEAQRWRQEIQGQEV